MLTEWFHSLHPGYQVREKEFEDYFGSSEKFVVDYSCAYHENILHQGRLYASTEGLNFVSNVLGWESTDKIIVKWSDVESISKETTAFLFPNAIQVSTIDQSHFFASFQNRTSAYMSLVRLWQAVQTNKELSEDDIHQIIACEYGMAWTTEDGPDIDILEEEIPMEYVNASENIKDFLKDAKGQVIFDEKFDISVKDLFNQIFSRNDSQSALREKRGATNVKVSDWEKKGEMDKENREIHFNIDGNKVPVPLGENCKVKEFQVKTEIPLADSRLMNIVTVVNFSGPPYADSFILVTNDFLMETGPNSSRLISTLDVQFKKDIWDHFQKKIEKRAWSNTKDYYCSLSKSLGGSPSHQQSSSDVSSSSSDMSGASSVSSDPSSSLISSVPKNQQNKSKGLLSTASDESSAPSDVSSSSSASVPKKQQRNGGKSSSPDLSFSSSPIVPQKQQNLSETSSSEDSSSFTSDSGDDDEGLRNWVLHGAGIVFTAIGVFIILQMLKKKK